MASRSILRHDFLHVYLGVTVIRQMIMQAATEDISWPKAFMIVGIVVSVAAIFIVGIIKG